MQRAGRILVADDNPRWRDALHEVLEQQGFLVDTASTPVQVLERLSQELYHLITLDIRFEDADESNAGGMDLLEEFGKQKLIGEKGSDRGNELHIIMLTAHGTKDQQRK